jgi:cobalt-precorrin 5A hydrolase
MGGEKTMMVAGIGCRRGCGGDVIAALVQRASRAADCVLSALAAPEFRRDEPGVQLAARTLALPLMVVDRTALAAAQPRCVTRSARAVQATGFASIAEAAALAAAGADAMLILPRIAGGGATCAIAGGGLA